MLAKATRGIIFGNPCHTRYCRESLTGSKTNWRNIQTIT